MAEFRYAIDADTGDVTNRQAIGDHDTQLAQARSEAAEAARGTKQGE